VELALRRNKVLTEVDAASPLPADETKIGDETRVLPTQQDAAETRLATRTADGGWNQTSQTYAPSGGPPGSTPLTAGSIFHGDFRIEHAPVKYGGMGEVYKARNTINNAIVALKLIRRELSHDTDIVARFKEEDDALRRLHDPAIVRYLGVRREPQLDQLYILMEYVDGPTLGEYVKKNGALPKEDVEKLCRRLAGGLREAHAQTVYHRDLSPDNILLDGGDLGQAKIIDFGIAKVRAAGEFTTFRSSFVGKFSYASPEHFSQTAEVSDKSDIYSLGLVLAAAAKGAPLNMGRDELSGAAARLRTPDLAGIHADLRALLSGMLNPNPKLRPDAATLASPPGNRGAGARTLWLGGSAAAVLLLAAGVALTQLERNGRPADNAVPRPPDVGASTTIPAATPPTVYPSSPPVSGATLKVALDALKHAIQSHPPACVPLQVAATNTGHILVTGMVADAADYNYVKPAATSLGVTFIDQVAVSNSACQLIRWVAQLKEPGTASSVNRPVLSIGRTPPVFQFGETVRANIIVPVAAGRHLYKLILRDSGAAAIQHSFVQSFTRDEFSENVEEPGWTIILLISSATDLTAFDLLGSTTIDKVNEALLSMQGSGGNPGNIMAAYQIAYRVGRAGDQ